MKREFCNVEFFLSLINSSKYVVVVVVEEEISFSEMLEMSVTRIWPSGDWNPIKIFKIWFQNSRKFIQIVTSQERGKSDMITFINYKHMFFYFWRYSTKKGTLCFYITLVVTINF